MQLALFDLDNTLLAGDSDFEWAQFLIDQGVLDREVQEARNLRFYEDSRAGTLNIQEVLHFQLAPLARHPRAELEGWHATYMARRFLPIIPVAARAKVRAHLMAGHLCALVTATNSFVTGPIAREFGFAHLIATIPAVEAGVFTGQYRGTPSFQAGKVLRVEAWLESLGLWWSNFEASWFYSDSHNDLPLLEKVSHPVAVNPDATLAAVAQQRGWQILSLREKSAPPQPLKTGQG
ncbi:MAG: HAD-IB family hydrolase [Zoogloeaceae bacterium]|jgi:HAD superfamily hydrolase (TIGR01490 family)|nr:HAD-IB family hydrolase [Zoogloeaceae bacterium]